MLYSPAFIFSSVYSLGVWLCAGLRLQAVYLFQVFLAVGAGVASARSYRFTSIAQLALVAIILQALRRLRGAVLFRGLRSS